MPQDAFSISTVIEDAKKVITDPVSYYRDMPTTGGVTEPLIFVLVMGAITGLVIALTGAGFAALLMVPIAMLIGSFISAAILYVVWKLMGSDKDYEVAYRCVSAITAIAPIVGVLALIPYVSTVVQVAWNSILLYIASTQVHKLNASTAKIVFGVLALLFITIGVKTERFGQQLEAKVGQYEDMSAEETGKALGKILKGLENAQREAEKD